MTDRTVQALLDSLHRYERLALSLNEENKKLLVMNADIVAMANEAVFQRNEWKTEAGKLKAERDEARREVCNLMRKAGFLNGDYARERGWNCFKEDTK
jgi:glutathionylspermidine synthase